MVKYLTGILDPGVETKCDSGSDLSDNRIRSKYPDLVGSAALVWSRSGEPYRGWSTKTGINATQIILLHAGRRQKFHLGNQWHYFILKDH